MRHDYKKIKEILDTIYNEDDVDFKSFEKSELHRDGMSDIEYAKEYMRFAMGLHEQEEVSEECAVATAGNTSGMGAVVTPQAGAVPGVPGAAGSGDIGMGFTNKNISGRGRKDLLPRNRRKEKVKNALKGMKAANIQRFNSDGYKKGGDKGASSIKSFTDFTN